MRYYVMMPCPRCDTPIYDGVNITLLEHRGYPVVNYDVAAQSRFVCPSDDCGAVTYTGDFDEGSLVESPRDGEDD